MGFFIKKLIKNGRRMSAFIILILVFGFILSGCDSDKETDFTNVNSTNINQNQNHSSETSENAVPNQLYFMHKDNTSSITTFKTDGSTLVDVDENGYFMYDDQKYRAFYNENGNLTWDQTYNSGLPMCLKSYEGQSIPVEIYNGDERLGIYEDNGKRYFLYNVPNSNMYEGYEISSNMDEKI